MLINDSVISAASECFEVLVSSGTKVAFAESCTGGMLSFLLTSFPGASSVLGHSVVAYSNDSKVKFLNVNSDLINTYGAVSKEVALAMSMGLFSLNCGIDLSLAVTGIAGPGGASDGKPVGLVYISCVSSVSDRSCQEWHFPGLERNEVRLRVAEASFRLLIEVCSQRYV